MVVVELIIAKIKENVDMSGPRSIARRFPLGTAGGAAFSLVGVNPIRLLVIVGVVNAIAAAPFLIIVMVIANDRSIMGEYQNGWLARILGWVTVAVMAAGAIAFLALS